MSGPPFPSSSPVSPVAPRRRGSTPTGGTTRSTSRPRSARSGRRSPRPIPPGPTGSRRTPGLPREAQDPRLRDRGVLPGRARRAAQARDRPRRLLLLREALRHRGGGSGHPLADDAGSAVGGRRRRPSAGSSRRKASPRSSPRAPSAPSWPRRSPARPGRRRTTPCTATPSGRPTPRGRPTSEWRRPTPTPWCGASRAGARGCTIAGHERPMTT